MRMHSEKAWNVASLFSWALASSTRDLAAAIDEAYPGWQPIATAPKDGTEIDLWCINHLHFNKAGVRRTNCKWGPVTDWMGQERDDWQGAASEDLEPTHWMKILPPETSK